uniref:Uncharacterized protein n=1 Tax=Strigamia maritima TaxID=126957 RepID=T1JE77_STRMM
MSLSSAKTQILQRIHLPVWRDVSLVTKWVGSLEYMQYYATVDPGELSPTLDNIHWLSVDNIEEKESMVVTDIPDMVGSGQGVGGVVSDTLLEDADLWPKEDPVDSFTLTHHDLNCCTNSLQYAMLLDLPSLERIMIVKTAVNLWKHHPNVVFSIQRVTFMEEWLNIEKQISKQVESLIIPSCLTNCAELMSVSGGAEAIDGTQYIVETKTTI